LPRFLKIEVDEYELQRYLRKEYEGTFGTAPQKVVLDRYPGELIVSIYTDQPPELSREAEFCNRLTEELDESGIAAIVMVQSVPAEPMATSGA
jgi:hypothetical protein